MKDMYMFCEDNQSSIKMQQFRRHPFVCWLSVKQIK